MVVIDLDLTLNEFDTQSNVKIPFELEKEAKELKIHFTYSPDKSSDEIALKQVKEGLEKYTLKGEEDSQGKPEDHLPIDNLITLSLSKDGKYLGGHHNKSNQQTITLTNDQASSGFWPVEIEPAKWELQLNCHCIASKEVKANVRIEVIGA